MAACETFKFEGITPQVFHAISKQLAQKGFILSGPRGTVHGPFGIVLDYAWDEQRGTITIQVIEKSFFITCNQIREQLTQALQQYT